MTAIIFLLLLATLNCLLAQSIITIENEQNYTASPTEYIYSPIENLHEYLSPFASSRCQITVDNIHGVNMISSPAPTPIILQRIAEVIISFGEFYKISYGPVDFISRNLASAEHNENITNCPISGLFEWLDVTQNNSGICLHLNKTRYIMHAKPNWFCEVRVALYPTDFYIEYILNSESAESISQPVLETLSAPSIKVFVMNQSSDVDLEDLQNCHNIFLQFRIKKVDESTVTIHQAVILRLCQKLKSWRDETKESKIILSEYPWNWTNLQDMLDMSLPSRQARHIWSILSSAYPETVYGQMEAFLQVCPRSSWYKLNFTSPILHVGYGYAVTWLSIIGNHTILHPRKWNHDSCTGQEILYFDYKTFKFVPYSTIRRIVSYAPRGEGTSLRFLSCGSGSFTKVPFEELINVYDSRSWVMILISTFLLAIFISIADNIKFYPGWLSPLKILIEQGDMATEKKRLRWAVGLFVLMGIVISNAYKNNNVYNMVAPRKPVAFKYARDLIAANFTIHTTLSKVDWFRETYLAEELRRRDVVGGSYLVFRQDYLFLRVLSRIATTMQNFVNTLAPYHVRDVEGWLDSHEDYVKSAAAESIMNTSGVLSNAVMDDRIERRLERRSRNVRFKFFDDFQMKIYFSSEMQRVHKFQQEIYSPLDRLGRCDNVAFILPEYVCHKYLRTLKTQFEHKFVYVGEERYTEVEWMFGIGEAAGLGSIGRVKMWTRHLLQRLKGAYESGLWAKWTNLVRKDNNQDANGAPPVAASLSGNVVVIFVVGICGVSVSCMAFLCENYRSVCRGILIQARITVTVMRSVVHRIMTTVWNKSRHMQFYFSQ